jgi:hypothetical protein
MVKMRNLKNLKFSSLLTSALWLESNPTSETAGIRFLSQSYPVILNRKNKK